jgi:hypothetical protein
MHTLHRFLVDYDMNMLRALAESRGAVLTTNRQTEAVDQLAAALIEPLSVKTALAHLSPEGRQALDTLLAAGGRMRVPYFSRRFGQVRPIGPGRLEREAPWQHPANPAEELLYAGLTFRAFAEDEAGPAEFVFVPQDLIPRLPQASSAQPTFGVQAVSGPSPEGNDGAVLVRDLFFYLVYLQNHDVRPYADGRLGNHDLTSLRQRLHDADERRLTFLLHLARRLGFVAQQDDCLRLETAPVKRWLSACLAHQLEALQRVWRDDADWIDLCHVPALVCDQQTGWHPQYDTVAVRRAFLSLLARCPTDTWWLLDSFVTAIKETHPDFQRPDGDYTSWYIRDMTSGEYLSGFESWDRVEGVLIANLLNEPLRWLGVVATTTKEVATLCRLTEPGARFLDLAPDKPEGPPSPPIVVHSDFYVDVPAPANLYTRFQLERFADLVSEEPCRYALTVRGLGRALARDVRVEQILAFLQQSGSSQVPANVSGQLRLWAGRFGQVELEEVVLLRVKSERVLKDLSVLPETRELIVQVLTPTTAMVRKMNLPRLRKALDSLGYLRLTEERVGDQAKRG